MGDDEASVGNWSVTPLQAGLLGSGVVAGGAFLSGVAHYTATAKALAEEGISDNARRKALPIAARALGLGTFMCVALGAAATGTWWAFAGRGLMKRSADLSSISDALSLANEQRVRDVFNTYRKWISVRVLRPCPYCS